MTTETITKKSMTSADVLAPVRPHVVGAAVLQTAAVVTALIPALAVAQLSRAAVRSSGSFVDSESFWPWVIAGGLSGIASILLAAAATVVTHVADADLQLNLRSALVEKIGAVPLGSLAGRSSGQIRTLVQDQVQALHYLLAHTVLEVVNLTATPVVAFILLAYFDPWLAVVSVLPLAVGIYFFARAMNGSNAQMAQYGAAQAEISSSIVEFVDGIAVLKTFGRAGLAHERYRDAVDRFSSFFGSWVARTTVATTISWLVVSAVPVLLLVVPVGTVMVESGWMDGADLVPFLILAPVLCWPVAVIGPRVQVLRAGMAAADAIAKFMSQPAQHILDETAYIRPRPTADSSLTLSEVSFGYGDARRAVREVTLELAPHTVTAIVGRSGSGKSTLAALVAGLYLPDSGTIRYAGVDVVAAGPHWNRNVGFVLQDSVLLRDTVLENLRLSRPDAPICEIVDAARLAAVDDVIEALPNRYDSVIGEDVQFSGGEAQRLSLARAIVADPAVLVLDEPTSHADPTTAARMQGTIDGLAREKTVLIVSHRLRNICGADRIVVMDSGQIAEQGTHTELLAADGLYRRMWLAQEGSA